MSHYKEIVTKAVIGKGKKTYKNKYNLAVDDDVNTVLGCWVINHNLSGTNNNGSVLINGSFDVNIWYSYDNNTKTNVATSRINYMESANVKLKEESKLTDTSDIIIECLRNPNCTDVSVKENVIYYEIEKELGIEIVGDTKVKIIAEDDADDYDIIEDEITEEEINNQIDEEVEEDFLDIKE